MINRHITQSVLEALSDTPVVFINGARQTGKSTLANKLIRRHYPAEYITLDDATIMAAAQADPTGFVSCIKGPVILDEVQRVPPLFLAIKAEVDRERLPGRFLLTGSANPMLLPRLSESLAGRMEILTLWPFSQGELEGKKERFIDAVFEDALATHRGTSGGREEILPLLFTGGYPEIQTRGTAQRRHAWYRSYITTMVQREVRDIANIDHLSAIPRLLLLLAARTGTLLNYAEVSNAMGLPQTTLKRYMALLEMTFLYVPLPAWATNLSKRVTRSSKVFLNDTGLASHLLGLNKAQIVQDPSLLGHLLENFVQMELLKQASWHRSDVRLFHFHTYQGKGVDIILENAAGQIVGVEVKASATVTSDDFNGLRALKKVAGRRFLRGIILYTGTRGIPFGERLSALPVSTLWQTG